MPALSQSQPSPDRSLAALLSLYLLGGIIAIVGVFILPWFVGGIPPVRGESYCFGFSNRSAVLALYSVVAIVTLYLWRRGQPILQKPLFEPHAILFPSLAKAKFQYGIVIFSSIVCVAGVLIWNAYLVIPLWGESSYFLPRMDLVALGYRPYADFQFNYGPALAYGPIGIWTILGGMVGFEDSYAIAVALGHPLGFLCLFIFLRTVAVSERMRTWILACSCTSFFSLGMGLQYTPLRFMVLLGALPLAHLATLRFAAIRWGRLWITCIVWAACISCFLISPEMGIACVLSLVSSAAILFLNRKHSLAACHLIAISLSLLGIWAFSTGYLHGIISHASGAQNLPIFPNLHNLLLVATASVFVPVASVSVWFDRADTTAPYTASALTAGVVLVTAALGRCDPGHVYLYGLILFILVFAALSQLANRRFSQVYAALYAVAFVVMLQFSYWGHYWENFEIAFRARQFYRENTESFREWAKSWARFKAEQGDRRLPDWRKTVQFPDRFLSFVQSGASVGIPLGVDIGIDRMLKMSKSFSPSYYPFPVPEIMTERDAKRAADECLQKYDIIIVRDGSFQLANQLFDPPTFDHEGYEKALCNYLSKLMLYPVNIPLVNPPFFAEREVSMRVLPAYVPTAKEGD